MNILLKCPEAIEQAGSQGKGKSGMNCRREMGFAKAFLKSLRRWATSGLMLKFLHNQLDLSPIR